MESNHVPLIISFSGGRTSAFMCAFLKQRYPDRIIHVVFVNTGKEFPQTLDFVQKCDEHFKLNVVWIEPDFPNCPSPYANVPFRIVNYQTASRNGQPFIELMKLMGTIPNTPQPFCSERMKSSPINEYIKTLNLPDYRIAIGIRADEEHRKSIKKENWRKIYPLCDEIRVDKMFIRRWWSAQCFDLELKDYQSNCDLCFKKSRRVKMTLLKENPQLAEWWIDAEKKFGGGKNVFSIEQIPMEDMRDLALNGKFTMVQDALLVSEMQSRLFEVDQDFHKDCFCKSS